LESLFSLSLHVLSKSTALNSGISRIHVAENKLKVASFDGDRAEYPIYIGSDDSDNFDATTSDSSITEAETSPNYPITPSTGRNICNRRKKDTSGAILEDGPNMNPESAICDIHTNERTTSRPGSVAEGMDPREKSTSIQPHDNPMPPTKRRRLQSRQQKLKSTSIGRTSAHCSQHVSDFEAVQSSTSITPQLHNTLQRYRCNICLEDLDSASFFNLLLEICCGHLRRVCVSCVQNWISSTLETNGPVNIRCPLCPQELTYDNIRSLATNDTFARYCTRFLFSH
jgi:hypothetical protein